MKCSEIREAFLKFFASKGHKIVPSSSLVPANDPTLLFTNAGMVQFKDVFLGDDKRSYTRATSSQRCVRAGGKHNDLENVGYTARHHTFFEMLGNFSFGDYFKQDAINYAWEFLTSDEWLGIPADKLTVTVYAEDDEAYNLWHESVGVPADKIIRIGDNKGGKYNSDNFWAMGDTGPCGPCTEIFYDHGEHIWGGPPGSPEEDGDRFIEIWNNVFMQFNRTPDGEMHPLPKPSVDTGMGLERIAAVMQHMNSNYEIDLFQNLLKAAAEIIGTDDLEQKSLRVIADHIRSCAFLIVDGVLPSNEGRGYVLRRIARRAIRHGNKLGCQTAFFHKLVKALVAEMGEAYPELAKNQAQVEKVLLAEEQQFAKTLDKGMAVLDAELEKLQGSEIPGSVVFTLYDTYGFPVDLTADIARERELALDMPGYEAAMDAQRQRARSAGSFKVDYSGGPQLDGATDFLGYNQAVSQSVVKAILVGEELRETIEAGEQAAVVLEQTPFYAESGGQVGDSGYLLADGIKFEVTDCQKLGDSHLHIGQLITGSISVGDAVTAEIESDVRLSTARNHSATHLLHAALRNVLGDHVAQKGSLCDAERLRFDFSHFEAVTAQELQQIESLVNQQVLLNTPVQTELCDMETAKSKGAMALFGEKYGEQVRVLSMGSDRFSVELCGGTHVAHTGEIGQLRITSESGIASGVRRIEAVTGQGALALFDRMREQLNLASDLLKVKDGSVVEKLESFISASKQQEKTIAQLGAKLAALSSADMVNDAVEIDGLKVLAVQVEGVEPKGLRDLADKVKDKLGTGALLLAAVNGEKISLIAGVTKDATARIKAGDIMKHAAAALGGKGGGKPDLAQGGGTDVAALPEVLAQLPAWIESQLK